MEAQPLLNAIASAGNIAVLVLVMANIGLLRLLQEVHKGLREDRAAAIAANEKLVDVLTQVRLELATNRHRGEQP